MSVRVYVCFDERMIVKQISFSAVENATILN